MLCCYTYLVLLFPSQIARLQSRLREKEDALSHARKSTHTANMERQEVGAWCAGVCVCGCYYGGFAPLSIAIFCSGEAAERDRGAQRSTETTTHQCTGRQPPSPTAPWPLILIKVHLMFDSCSSMTWRRPWQRKTPSWNSSEESF